MVVVPDRRRCHKSADSACVGGIRRGGALSGRFSTGPRRRAWRLTSELRRMKTNPRVQLFGISIDPLDMNATVDAVLAWCRQPRQGSCRFIVTPNVDHA